MKGLKNTEKTSRVWHWFGTLPFPTSISEKTKESKVVLAPTGSFLIAPGKHGQSVYAKTEFQPKTLVTVYPGTITSSKTLDRKMSRLSPEKQVFVQRYLVHWPFLDNAFLDPTDSLGNLMAFCANNPAPFMNEPDPDQKENCVPVVNWDTFRMEIWSLSGISPGTELLLSYGHSYARDYVQSLGTTGILECKDNQLGPFVKHS